MTARQLIARLNWPQDLAGVPVVDTGWFRGAIYQEIIAARAALINADREKAQWDINVWPEQTLGCLLMEEVPTEECPCVPPSGCTWFRTVFQVPETAGEYRSVNAIGGNLGKLRQLSYRDWFRIKDVFVSRIKAERARNYYTRKNNYVYTLSHEPISVTAVFRDPIEVQRRNCDGLVDYCKPFLDFDMYVPAEFEAPIIQLVAQSILSLRGAAPMDTTNNAQSPQGIEPIKQ